MYPDLITGLQNHSARTIANDLKMRHLSENVGYLGASLQQLSYASLIVVGALTVMRGEMTTGGLIACSILSGRILNPILAVPGLMIQRAHARAAEDGLEKLYQLKTDNHGVRRPLVPERLEGRFLLEDVSFAYGDNPPALRVPRLLIKPGERIAVIGPIGSGKSTLLGKGAAGRPRPVAHQPPGAEPPHRLPATGSSPVPGLVA